MAMTIWKFGIASIGTTLVEMPTGARVLSVQNQMEVVTLWALVDPDAPSSPRNFCAVQTGGDGAFVEGETFIGTVQLARGSFVAHVFEVE